MKSPEAIRNRRGNRRLPRGRTAHSHHRAVQCPPPRLSARISRMATGPYHKWLGIVPDQVALPQCLPHVARRKRKLTRAAEVAGVNVLKQKNRLAPSLGRFFLRAAGIRRKGGMRNHRFSSLTPFASRQRCESLFVMLRVSRYNLNCRSPKTIPLFPLYYLSSGNSTMDRHVSISVP